MDLARSVATAVRRALLGGRRTFITLVVLLLILVLMGWGWATMLALILASSVVLGGRPPVPPAVEPSARPYGELDASPPTDGSGDASPATSVAESVADSEPTLEKAFAKIGLEELPPFDGQGEVATYTGPRKLRLTPDNPIEQLFDGRSYTMRCKKPSQWLAGRDRQGQPILRYAKEWKVPVADIISITWREPDPRFDGDKGRGDLHVRYEVGRGKERTTAGSKAVYFRADRVQEFRQLRDAISAATGLSVGAARSCLENQAHQLLRRAQGPYQVMGPDGHPIVMPAERL